MNALAAATTPALQLLTTVPEGFHAIKVRRHHPASLYTKGMHVIVDPSDTELVHQADYAVQWDEYRPVSIIGIRHDAKGHWWVGPAGGGHSQILGDGAITLSDGPYLADGLSKALVGRIVGYLGDESGRPMTELWDDPNLGLPSADAMDLADLPTAYAMICKGTCLEPIYPDGTRFQFSTEDPIETGDYVVLWRKPHLTRQGQMQALAKRLLTPIPAYWDPEQESLAIPPVVIVETHNPPRSYVVPLDQIMAIHKSRGVYDGPQLKASRAEVRALAAEQRARRSA